MENLERKRRLWKICMLLKPSFKQSRDAEVRFGWGAGRLRVRRWRGNVLSPLSESFSCWQTSSWPFPSQTMNLLYFSAPASFPRAVCLPAASVHLCVGFICVCVSFVFLQMASKRNEGPTGCLSILSMILPSVPQALILHFCLFLFPNSQNLFPILGESGLGKSTLINSLFLTDLYSKDYPGPSQRIKKTVQVRTLSKWCWIVVAVGATVTVTFTACRGSSVSTFYSTFTAIISKRLFARIFFL